MSRALLIVKIIVTAALLGGVLAAADLSTLARHFGDASWSCFAAAVVALILQTFVLAVRFRTIVAALGQPITARFAIELSFVGALFNQALPSAIGGDAIRMWRMRTDGRPWRDTVNAVLLDRGSGVLVLAALAAVAVTLEGGVLAPLRLVLWGIVATGIVGVAVVASAERVPLPHALHRLLATSGLPAAVRTVFGMRVAPEAAALSAVSHLLAALAVYWLAIAFGIETEVGAFVAATLCVLLAIMIPLSYAGWGIREVGAVWVFAQIGIVPELALGVSVLFGAALFLASLPGLKFWFAPSLDQRDAQA